MTAPESLAPFVGVRVVENDSFVAGPTAGLTLAQLGADVIKIDPLAGGPDRGRWPLDDDGASLFWASLNRGKKSVALDLRSPRGQELAVALITAPDPADGTGGIFVDNNVGRAFLGHDRLREVRPDLVHVRIQGKADGRPGVDYTVNAESGVPVITGPRGWGEPVNSPVPTWDLITGMATTTAVAAGLHRRATTGQGGYFEIALEDVALATLANMGWLTSVARGEPRERIGNHVYGTFGTDFATADGSRVMVVALTPRQWKVLVEATGTGDVFAALERGLDLDLTQESARYERRNLIREVLAPWIAARPVDEVARVFDEHGVLWSRYRTFEDVATLAGDGAFPALFPQAAAASGPPTVTPASPIRLDGRYGEVGAPTRLGADTEEVLAEVLGLGTHELGDLAEHDVIGLGRD